MAPEQLKGYFKEPEDRINWVLSHPGMSDWMKQSLSAHASAIPLTCLTTWRCSTIC